MHKLTMTLLSERFVIVRFNGDEEISALPSTSSFYSVTRTREELSVVCTEEDAPAGGKMEGPWMALKIEGPIPFSQTGVLESVLRPLADAHVSIFALSTYDTDYILIRDEQWLRALQVLRHHHTIREASYVS